MDLLRKKSVPWFWPTSESGRLHAAISTYDIFGAEILVDNHGFQHAGSEQAEW